MFSRLLLMSLLSTVHCQSHGDADRLLKYLFNETKYNKEIRPVLNISTRTQVNLSHVMYSLDSYDATEGSIVTTSILTLSWRDEFLAWNSSEYAGIESLIIPRSAPWIPDIAVLKGLINQDLVLGHSDFLPVRVKSTGDVYIYPGGKLESMCSVDTFLHPFDVHECEFSYLSAQYATNELFLNFPEPGIDLNHFSENPEWMVESGESVLREKKDHSVGLGMALGIKRLILRRRPAFDLVHSYLPSFLLFLLNIATCYVPFEIGDRINFSITVFMSFVLLCGSVVAEFPRNGISITLTSYLIIVANVVNVFSVIWSIILFQISKRSAKEQPVSQNWRRLVSFCEGEIGLFKCKHLKQDDKVEPMSENEHGQVFDVNMEVFPVEGKHQQNGHTGLVTARSEKDSSPLSETSWHDVAKCLDKLFYLALIITFIIVFVVWIGVLAGNCAVLSN